MVILVSSQIQNVGKSSLALLLTFTLSKEGKRVLLIDADVGRWTLTDRLGLGGFRNLGMAGKYYDVKELDYTFIFGFCDMVNAVKVLENCEYTIIDLDVSRSKVHNEYYFKQADLVITPQPSWTIDKVADWIVRFGELIKEATKAEFITYPIAVKFEDEELEHLKWVNYEVYKAMKKAREEARLKEGQGIEYNEEWARYISLKEYDEKEVKRFIEQSIKALKEDLKEYLKLKGGVYGRV